MYIRIDIISCAFNAKKLNINQSVFYIYHQIIVNSIMKCKLEVEQNEMCLVLIKYCVKLLVLIISESYFELILSRISFIITHIHLQ